MVQEDMTQTEVTQDADVSEPTQKTKRQERKKKIADANKITLILDTEVRKFLTSEAKDAGMNIAPYLLKVLENHVMESAPDENALKERLKAKRAVLDFAVDLALKIKEAGEFDEHFIGNVVGKARKSEEFCRLYDIAVGDDADTPKKAARARAPLNQQLGRLIKRAAGAKSKRDEAGKIMRAQVQGELISTYTLLELAS